MAKAKEQGDFKRELPEPGTEIARCVKVIHLGTQVETFKGESKEKIKVKLVWELPHQMHQFKADAPKEPFRVNKEYTFSIHEKANFRKDIESWGKVLTNEEKEQGYDPKGLLGKACQLTIANETSAKGNEYTKVKAIAPLAKEKMVEGEIVRHAQKCPPRISEFVYFDPEDKSTYGAWDLLFKNEKEKIRKSPEFQKVAQLIEPPENQAASVDSYGDDNDEDMPF